MKISLERLLAESSRLQDYRQRNCVICSLTVESAVLSGHHVKDECRRVRAVVADTGVNRSIR